MTSDLTQKIMDALSAIETDGGNIVALKMVSGLHVGKSGDVVFALEVDPAKGAILEPLRQKAESAVKVISGIRNVTVVLTAERPPPAARAQPQPENSGGGHDPHGMNKNPPLELPFRHVIAVGSGKGGVGKSTVAFNLAVALAREGQRVALLDADIYGPSVPRITGTRERKGETNDQGKIEPIEAHGLKIMSMGYLVEEDRPMIWRGPMVQTAFYQMLRDVAWRKGDEVMDTLIIDMPPGTGDVQLTLAQKVPVTGAVVVSTPQDLALVDARKAIAMFEKTDVKILGLIENMSSYCCPACGHRDDIFGHGGAREEAQKRGVPFLGEVPLNAEIRQKSDDGEPLPDIFYKNIGQALKDSVKTLENAPSHQK